ncbi:hypothetical protein B2J69_09735 [Pantoea latae]|uniref:Uncharacterized protein n=1 Tax=Pantoea latae TaxID=1964541 RepID=A0A1V9DJP1_9GAMM|nr:hypothetical protein B2J69_09735 [Pantoea latae]
MFIDDDDACSQDEISDLIAYVLPVRQCQKHIAAALTVAGTYIRLHMNKGETLHFFLSQDL